MPSQEDYLDNLLRNLDNSNKVDTNPVADTDDIMGMENMPAIEPVVDMENMSAIESAFGIENGTDIKPVVEENDFSGIEIDEIVGIKPAIGVEDTKTMTEEEIEQLLTEGQEYEEQQISVPEMDDSIDGLMELLSQAEDDDLQEIHSLLDKSENNEAVDEGIIALLQDIPDEDTDLLETILAEPEETLNNVSEQKQQKAAEKKRLRDERRAERLAEREIKKALQNEKKAARLEEKAAKAAEKKSRKEAREEARKKELRKEDVQVEEVNEEPVVITEPDFFAVENSQSEMAEFEPKELETQIFGSQDSKTQEVDIFGEMQGTGEDDISDIEALLGMAGGDISVSSNDTQTGGNVFAADIVESIVEKNKPRKKKAISRILDYLTESAEDEENDKNNEDIPLSDENKTILEEMDKGKKKKKKDKKDKKGKKGKNEEENSSADGEDEKDGDEKPKKQKKAKKPKKEKLPKEIIVDDTQKFKDDKKLSIKKVLPIALVCMSIGVIIILVANLAGDYSAKAAGREAYYNGDYQTCYQNLYGKDLNASEQIMYGKSESILRIRLWIREYELLASEGAEAEALDSLIQSVYAYPKLDAYASQWNAGGEVKELYAQILSILSEKYRLTEAQALEIASTEEDVEYSKMVYAIIDGEGFGSWNEDAEEPKEETEVLQDVLPEEEELDEIEFVDNNEGM